MPDPDPPTYQWIEDEPDDPNTREINESIGHCTCGLPGSTGITRAQFELNLAGGHGAHGYSGG